MMLFRKNSPSKEMNKKQKQAVEIFFKAMNDNKEVLEIVDGEFVVKKKGKGTDETPNKTPKNDNNSFML